MKVKSEREVTQSCPTLRDPMDRSLPGSSVHGIFQARVLEWGAPADFKGVRAGVEYGSANTVTARASAYGKTEGGLAIGGGIGFRHSDGFYTNAFSGEKCDPYDGDRKSTRLNPVT